MKYAKCAKIFTICSAHPNTAASDSSSKSKQLHFQLIAIDRSPPRFLRSNRSVQSPPTIGSKTSFDRYCLQIAKLHPAAAAAAADSKQKCIKHLTRFGRRRHGARVESGSSSFGCRSDPDPVPSNRPKKNPCAIPNPRARRCSTLLGVTSGLPNSVEPVPVPASRVIFSHHHGVEETPA